MRLIIEIVIVILLGIFIFKLTGQKKDLLQENRKFKKENLQYQDSITFLNDCLEIKEKKNDSLKNRGAILASKIEDTEKEKEDVEKAYRDSLDKTTQKTLEELAGDTSKIIRKGDSSYVLTDEENYHEFKKNEVKLKKVKKLYGLCEQQVEKQKKLIDTKNLRLANYKKQIKIKDKQLRLKNNIVDNKDKEIENLEKENKRQKWFKRGAIGAAVIFGILAL